MVGWKQTHARCVHCLVEFHRAYEIAKGPAAKETVAKDEPGEP